MKNKLYVIPECYVDTNLIKFLLNSNVNHQHGCSNVVKLLNSKFKDSFAIGIIDKDKVKQGYIEECDEIGKTDHLVFMKHKLRHQYFITVSPAIDGFLLDCAREQGVDLSVHRLPCTLKAFTDETKKTTSNEDSRFKSLFSAISGSPEIAKLKCVLDYLCDRTYQAEISEIEKMLA